MCYSALTPNFYMWQRNWKRRNSKPALEDGVCDKNLTRYTRKQGGLKSLDNFGYYLNFGSYSSLPDDLS